jgi:YggT family protein
MDFGTLIIIIRMISQLFIWIVIAAALLSFFVPPYHPIREALDRIVNPFLEPIRRIIPPAGTMDFSPLVLIVVVEIISRLLIALLNSLS